MHSIVFVYSIECMQGAKPHLYVKSSFFTFALDFARLALSTCALQKVLLCLLGARLVLARQRHLRVLGVPASVAALRQCGHKRISRSFHRAACTQMTRMRAGQPRKPLCACLAFLRMQVFYKQRVGGRLPKEPTNTTDSERGAHLFAIVKEH